MEAVFAGVEVLATYLMGMEAGIQAVDLSGVIHVDPVIPELEDDPDFQRGFVRGALSQLSRVKPGSQGMPKIILHDREKFRTVVLQPPVYLLQFVDGGNPDRFHTEPVFDDRDQWGDERPQLDANSRRKFPLRRNFPRERRMNGRKPMRIYKRARQISQGLN